MEANRSFLLCDDCDEFLHVLEQIVIENLNYKKITKCANGMEAISFFKQGGGADIIISDYDMKCIGGSGLDLLNYVEDLHNVEEFILLSGEAESSRFRDLQREGRLIFIPKFELTPEVLRKSILKEC